MEKGWEEETVPYLRRARPSKPGSSGHTNDTSRLVNLTRRVSVCIWFLSDRSR